MKRETLGARRWICFVAAAAAWFCAAAHAQEKDARTLVAEANRAFAEERYEAALEAYRAAEVTEPESPELAYNQGVAHFKLGDFDAARGAFNRALLTRDLGLEAKVKFNLGNVAYASALEKMSNLQEAIDLLKSAMGHYRDAIALNAEDADARTNIGMAQLLIKDLLDKLKKQQEEQKKQQQNQDPKQGEQDQKQQQQQKDESSKEDQQKGDSQDKKQGDQSEDKPQDPQGGQQDQQQDQQQAGQEQQEPQPRSGTDMTRQEAERLLQAVRDKERKRRDEKARRLRARRVPVLKDW